MAGLREQCRTCQKANSIPKWGWVMPCNDKECNYTPHYTIEELQAMTTVASYEIPRYKKKSNQKAPTKSKHKHRYEPCVVEYPADWYTKEHLRDGKKTAEINGYCPVCGKIGQINLEQWYGRVYHVIGISIEPTEQGQRELNPETRTLPTFQVDDPFAKSVDLGG